MKRYHILDKIRGITLCSMILYHAVWDLVYIFGKDWAWYQSKFAYVWQQSICWSFILLSGFCFSLGKRKWRRGFIVLGAGALVSVVTQIFMPEQSIRFGVLTMLGSSMLILTFIEKVITMSLHIKVWEPKHPLLGTVAAFGAFFLTRGINERYLGFEGIYLRKLPDELYQNGDWMTYIGFMSEDFYSTDYFSMMPWFFLFLTGYFIYFLIGKMMWLERGTSHRLRGGMFSFMGRNSLIIYLLHQPLIYAVLYILLKILLWF